MQLPLIRSSLLLLFLLVFSGKMFPASILLDDSKGLSNNIITEIMQDNKGLLWIGTHSGLNTYDGYTFREIPEFKSAHITCIRHDAVSDRIWVGTENGLYYINLKTSNIINCTDKSTLRAVVEIIVQPGAVFVGFHGGSVLEINRNDAARVLYSVKKLNRESLLNKGQMVADGQHIYLAPTKYNRLIKLTIAVNKPVLVERIEVPQIRNMACHDSLLILNTENKGVSVVNLKSQQHLLGNAIGELNKANGSPEFAYYRNNKLYLAYKGLYWLYIIDVKTGAVSRLSSDNSNENFRTRIIYCMYEDHTGVLWIGTTKGLVKSYENTQLDYTPILSNSISPTSIRQITYGEPGYLYISTYNGLFRYNKHSKDIESIKRPEPTEALDFPNYFRALLYDSSGYLYAGTESRAYFFFRYNLKTHEFEKDFFNNRSPDIDVNASYSLLKDRHNTLWMATDKGLASYNEKTGSVTVHRSDKFHTGNNSIMSLSPSARQNYFWAGGKDGLFMVHNTNGIETHFNNLSKPALADDEIIFVSEDPYQNVWIGYKKSGLYILDKSFHSVTQINKSNGLSSNEVYGILWQGKDTAWISTLSGLCCYAVKSKTFTNYFVENGLPDNEFNQNSYFADGNDFFFGGVNGVIRFVAPQIKQQPQPTLFVSSVSRWDKNSQAFINAEYTDSIGSITMKPSDHLLTFTFGLSDYTNTEANSYFYRIKGLYNEWIALGTQNILRLEGLPAGTFTIQVIAFNKKGVQSVNMLNYKIDIKQVFYRTWWFYLIASLCMAVLIILYFRWRLQNLQRLQQLRTQIASNLHDEVGSLLTSIIISTDSARYSSDTIDEKNAKLEKVAALSRNATNTMSDVLWSIDSRNDYAGNLTDRMREHAEAMLLPLDIEVEFDFTETNQEQNIKPDTRQNLYLIFKESINNIVKHSKANTVNVLYKQLGSQFEMTIRNNNPNNKAGDASIHQGQGLRNMEMRAKKIDAVLRYEITGTWVTVHIGSK
jgi:ligand-binding sensor domain-containing protein/signal transduction histidine kinase